MTRWLYAYFLDAKPDEAVTTAHTTEELLGALSASRLANDEGFRAMEFYIDEDGHVTGETNPSHGSVEQDDGFVDVVAAIAARFPDYIFEFHEENTEDSADACDTTFRNGTQTRKVYRRTLEPNELDQPTAKAIVDYLKANGHEAAAGAVATEFVKEP